MKKGAVLKIVGAVLGLTSCAMFSYAVGKARGKRSEKSLNQAERNSHVRDLLDVMFERYEETDVFGDKYVVRKDPASGMYACRKIFANKANPSTEVLFTPQDEADFLDYVCSQVGKRPVEGEKYAGVLAMKNGTHIAVKPLSVSGHIKGI